MSGVTKFGPKMVKCPVCKEMFACYKEHAWKIGDKLVCSYHCMRKIEVPMLERKNRKMENSLEGYARREQEARERYAAKMAQKKGAKKVDRKKGWKIADGEYEWNDPKVFPPTPGVAMIACWIASDGTVKVGEAYLGAEGRFYVKGGRVGRIVAWRPMLEAPKVIRV